MTRLSPDAMETEMFGLYAMTGKSHSFFGAYLYAMATDFFGTQERVSLFLAAWLLGGLFFFSSPPRDLMAEVSHPGENHRDAGLVGCRDHFLVTDRTARLNDSFRACVHRC